MSGKSCASGSVRSAGSVRLGPAASHDFVLDALYERKRDNKSVRVLTVIIYVFCVSLAAIMLSLYYVFFWEPKDAQYAQRKEEAIPQ
ncbi:putative transmembrane protein INAFM2 isoform X2 [Pectinophora gossypiella]|uniref:putative transmembrane protein INAFM2 isoform X2 n=1 Tax=Pectinophora gossypiella TaxID=13191 RepID=UPI00214F0467|nr:putative transmembrane protein INAFM2 isoform X2 [Pectinophora gossypiella]